MGSIHRNTLLACLLLIAGCRSLPSTPSEAQASVAVIPAPAFVTVMSGSFTVSADTAVVGGSDPELQWIARYFSDLVQKSRGITFSLDSRPDAPLIEFALDPAAEGSDPESYTLVVEPKRIRVSARDRRGLFYGAITLWQLVTADESTAREVKLGAMRIVDAPRFHWRGVMLDSARHFQEPAEIERFIDGMATTKLNVLHWHLTDDQGWRLEIKKYPRLTEVGAWRVPAGHAAGADIDPATGKPRLYGGFYSQETVRHLVEYAAKRGVAIVPEIEMPGHATAAIVAYPELGVSDTPPKSVPSDWGIYTNLYNVDEPTLKFLEDVLDEVMALFPGEYIHVGGDEAVKTQWQASPRLQARMRELGVPNEAALQSFVVHRMERHLSEHGRRLIGWDEILEGGIAPHATVMSWRGVEGAVTAAHAGHDTVLSPSPTLYLDHVQSDAAADPPGRGGVISTADIYRFNPLPATLKPEEASHVLGLQADLWTEHIRSPERVEFMTFPRVAALAEVGWSPAERLDWPGFVARLVPQYARYRTFGIRASDSPFAVRVAAQFHPTHGQVAVELANATGFGEIRYTIDGSDPTAASTRFAAPLELAPIGELRAATFFGALQLSTIITQRLDPAAIATRTSRELKLCGEALPLALEDDGPLEGPRAVFLIDLMNPCWVYAAADLTRGTTITAAVGQLPFNFQIGDDVHKIRFGKPASPAGELEVRLDTCTGERIAVLPLAPAAASDAVTTLPTARLAPRSGTHDLCLAFTQNGVDPIWAVDWVRVSE